MEQHTNRALQAQYEAIYRAHAPAVHAYCLRRTSSEDAKDALADVFVVAWRRFDDLPEDDDVLPWLYVVARNVLKDRQRSRRRQARLTAKVASQVSLAVDGPEPQVVRSSEHEAVLRALERLPDRDREAIRLVEWEGVSRDQVAEMMFVSRSAIDKRISRAYKKMARTLGVNRKDVRTTPVPIKGGES